MPNHLSELDTLFLGPVYNKIYPSIYNCKAFAKNTIKYYPFIGWLLTVTNTIFVTNRNKTCDVNQYDYIQKKIAEYNQCQKHVLIFPEGMTFNKNIMEQRNYKYLSKTNYEYKMSWYLELMVLILSNLQ